ncbi:bifunctional glutamate--cysteine ligase GshA/glutathione synthetase GshB [Pisciglobus halotolerans]|uniref:Glutathione biosynthesis bifunctional protein GshAB n=1 Tax=Pisciglobus halotolerans TaxID=745365 RepID=A0A1I3DEH5_9LACT|nr:bifunctional glutamate--cysteine ligase GshA/glutathione synthetase GshB [Pisciglobus halotolerans]SFH84989.1 glutamate-cysteine ligase /glutathione synthase [Pisciglobus halotolerans]
METIKEIVTKEQLGAAWDQAIIGVEKESLRVLEDGSLALTEHPEPLGKRIFHPYIQTDFSESQVELITPPVASVDEVEKWLAALHDVTIRSMKKEEYLWPFSIPAHVPDEKDIPIAKLEKKEDVLYREYLAETYGKKKQLISGIHINLELNPALIQALYEKANTKESLTAFRNQLYVKMSRNFLRYYWLLSYLFGASPIADQQFFDEEQPALKHPVRSIRNSHYGYVNSEEVAVSFDSLEQYVEDIAAMVEKGYLSEEREFYSPIRFRGTTTNQELLEEGISYIELRNLDLNPYDEFGLNEKTIRFIHLFCLYLIWIDEIAEAEERALGKKMNNATALEKPEATSQYLEEGLSLLDGMKEMILQTSHNQQDLQLIASAEETFYHPEKTMAARIIKDIQNNGGYASFGLQLAQQYKKRATEKPYALRGFTNMEMSTQLLLFDALQKGVAVEILDEQEQFLKLTYNGKEEIVKNANMTSKDTYVAPLIMENKTVTKKILAEKGYHVPSGEEYISARTAKEAYWQYQHKAIVVKPKSTNYGIGISIFKQGPALEDYEAAIDFAFKEDNAVLVEEFIEGTEYRLFVINKEVPAVLLRIPANVKGNGKDTIETLVHDKNADPLRGLDHRAPLEKIQLGEIEQLMLKEQGYTTASIPGKDEIVYLRENSNISTGGDSIDQTDEMDESYKKIAVGIAEAVGAEVSGVDLIIPDLRKPSTKEQPGYTVIEANFNPAMHMHAYVTKGKGRRLTLNVLSMLFPELDI